MKASKKRVSQYRYLTILVVCAVSVAIMFFTKSIKDIPHSHIEVESISQKNAFKVITSGCDLLLDNNFCVLLKTKS